VEKLHEENRLAIFSLVYGKQVFSDAAKNGSFPATTNGE